LWSTLAVVLVGVAAVAFFSWWVPAQEARGRAKEVAKLRSGTDLRYWDIKLGMPKAEVRYLKGDPTSKADATADSKETWAYKTDESTYVIYWNKDSKVDTVLCGSGCERIVGVGIGTSEARVRAVLGAPFEDNPPTDKGDKFLVYGAPTGGVVFMLSRGQVELIAVDAAPTRKHH
jgi:hypothetical protein